MELPDLQTPALVLDEGKLAANAARMARRAREAGVALRPHLKTAKSAAVARIALSGFTPRLTVSTLDEAGYFLKEGFTDILYAVCLSANKVAGCARLLEAGARLTVIVADERAVDELIKRLDGQRAMDVMIEIDCGEHRTGLAPDDPAIGKIAQRLDAAAATHFAGVMTHGGHAYAARGIADVRRIAEEERRSVIDAAARIESAGVACPARSIGSTPTIVHGRSFEGVTEIRPGVYVFGDLYQMQAGTCTLDDIAVSVLATVIAADQNSNRLVVDAGALALSKDRSTAACEVDYGFGLVCRADGSPIDGAPCVTGVHQEHGEVTAGTPLPFGELPPGSQVRILPNHACMTAAPYPEYFVVRGPGPEIVDRWHKTRGW